MTFPISYDSDDLLFGDLHDQMSVTLSQGCLAVDTELFLESVEGVTAPGFLWMEGELIKVTGVIVDSLNVERDPDIAIAHQAGTAGFVVIAAEHLNIVRDRAAQTQKYQGLVGADAAKPVNPSVSEVYIAIDTEKVYVCVTAGQWSLLCGATTHDDVQREGKTDDHPQYFTDGRLNDWHNSLTGEHVTDGDNHDHRAGAGTGRIQVATSATLPNKGVGYVRLATDTGEIYLGTGLTTWITVTGAPSGTIIMLQEADAVNLYGSGCPSGWVRYTELDGKFPKGAASGSYSLGSGGALTHYHTYSQVPEHLHSVPQMSGTSGGSGSHTHSVSFSTAAGGEGVASTQGVANGDPHATTASGAHTHNFTYPQVSTSVAGSGASANTSEVSNLPPFKEVVFCKKL